MKERPIIFSTDMVKAILDGRKTMTRRVAKFANHLAESYDHCWVYYDKKQNQWQFKGRSRFSDLIEPFILDCPYGQVGDRLWVRETWCDMCPTGETKYACYKADPENQPAQDFCKLTGKWQPSIFMPRWASRLTLEITEVRVERINDISYEDARLEGFLNPAMFHETWNSLNAKRGYGWKTNPWVWVIKFDNIGVRVK